VVAPVAPVAPEGWNAECGEMYIYAFSFSESLFLKKQAPHEKI
jgi:hypothetical protein